MKEFLKILVIVIITSCIPAQASQEGTETARIKNAMGSVKRPNLDTLVIHFENGKKITFKNVEGKSNTHGSKYYIYRGFDKISMLHLVEIDIHEDVKYLAIGAADGAMQRVAGFPVHSPQKIRFLCFQEGNELIQSEIEIFSMKNGKLTKEFKYDEPWMVEKVRWKSERLITFNAYTLKTDKHGKAIRIYKKGAIRHSGHKWVLNIF